MRNKIANKTEKLKSTEQVLVVANTANGYIVCVCVCYAHWSGHAIKQEYLNEPFYENKIFTKKEEKKHKTEKKLKVLLAMSIKFQLQSHLLELMGYSFVFALIHAFIAYKGMTVILLVFFLYNLVPRILLKIFFFLLIFIHLQLLLK